MKQKCLLVLLVIGVLFGCSVTDPAGSGSDAAVTDTSPGDVAPEDGETTTSDDDDGPVNADDDLGNADDDPSAVDTGDIDVDVAEPPGSNDATDAGGESQAPDAAIDLDSPGDAGDTVADAASDDGEDSDPDAVVSNDAGPLPVQDAGGLIPGDDDVGPDSDSGLEPPAPEPQPQPEPQPEPQPQPEPEPVPQPCAPGTWDHDTDPATTCVPFTECVPGQYIVAPPSPLGDRQCTSCVEGTFSTTPNAVRCVSFTSCNPGQVEATPGTATSDRVCVGQTVFDCTTGTWDADLNPTTPCVPHTTCVAGEYVLSAGTATSDRQCGECTGKTYSNRNNAATCTAWTTCVPGQAVLVAGNETRDQSCGNCPGGYFSDEADAAACTLWSSCGVGTFVATPAPSRTRDRSCQACPVGSTTTAPNQTACLPEGVTCEAGTVEIETGAGPACDECDPGTYCAGGDAEPIGCDGESFDDDLDAATPCIAKATCAEGYRVLDAGDEVTDRSCMACAAGTFSAMTNADTCTPFSGCDADEFVSTPGTSTQDDVCTQLEVLQIAAGARHTCVRLNDGGVRCWGEGGAGQLGTGTDADLNAPPSENIGGLGFVTHIAVGSYHTCAVQEAGTVRCWGRGTEGQLGYDGPAVNRLSPGGDVRWKNTGTVLMVFDDVAQVVAGTEHTCARLATGQLSCWGSNAFGQLGYDDVGVLHIPGSAVPLPGEDDTPVELVAGWAHTCARFDDGAVRCWGFSESGETGYGSVDPVRTAGGDLDFDGAVVKRLAANNGAHTCAVLGDDNLRCWGWGQHGRTGYDLTTDIPSDANPLPMAANVPLGGLVATIGVGDGHSCAALQNGGLRCWGLGNTGQLGYGAPLADVADGVGDSILEAGNVNLALGTGVGVEQIAAGGDGSVGHTCVLASDGNVRCWGHGEDGQLGYGNSESLATPGPNLVLFPD